MDRDLESKLTKAALLWPKGKPGLEDELRRIARDHEEGAIAWRRLGPFVGLLLLFIAWLIFAR